ncbi:MAG: YgaP family membrane protein [Burkholderiaceae bacterium]
MAIQCNVGGVDKIIRIVAGVVLAALALFSDIAVLWKILAGLAGTIALITATVGFCPLNSLLGVNTCKTTL